MKVCSWNILVQTYFFSELRRRLVDRGAATRRTKVVFPKHLRSEARLERIVQMLTALQADFICLQEVERYEALFAAFHEQNIQYEGLYVKRPSQSITDGCAMLYNAGRFDSGTTQSFPSFSFTDMN